VLGNNLRVGEWGFTFLGVPTGRRNTVAKPRKSSHDWTPVDASS